MPLSIPAPIKGCLTFGFIIINTLFWCVPVLLMGVLKVILPFPTPRFYFNKLINAISTAWISANNMCFKVLLGIEWDVRGVDALQPEGWYLVISNHQSWVDILVLQHVLNRRIPFLKFFIKKELIWVPVMGLIWWAQDFPFMKRYSQAFIKKNPHLKGQDLAITRKACEKFSTMPVSVMNFVEGTRFTPEKHQRQDSPFDHLLKPKAGGIAFVLAAMGHQLNSIVDVTIAYPGGIPTMWDFVSGKISSIIIDIKQLPIDESIRGNYFTDEKFKESFHIWINELWESKEQQLCKMLGAPIPESPGDREAA